jgi:hypothetical protein
MQGPEVMDRTTKSCAEAIEASHFLCGFDSPTHADPLGAG